MNAAWIANPLALQSQIAAARRRAFGKGSTLSGAI
jgi:hypothetical protein